jgi:hypothetical protein
MQLKNIIIKIFGAHTNWGRNILYPVLSATIQDGSIAINPNRGSGIIITCWLMAQQPKQLLMQRLVIMSTPLNPCENYLLAVRILAGGGITIQGFIQDVSCISANLKYQFNSFWWCNQFSISWDDAVVILSYKFIRRNAEP